LSATPQTVSGIDRRRDPRTDLHLNVILLQEGQRPRGCRVLNVSKSGMFLEWSDTRDTGKTAAQHFKRGDAIKILFSFRTASGRKHLELPSQVMRTEGKGIGIAFDEPQQVIDELVGSFETQGKTKPRIGAEQTSQNPEHGIFSDDVDAPDNTSQDPMNSRNALTENDDPMAAFDSLPDIDDPQTPGNVTFDYGDGGAESGIGEDQFVEVISELHAEHRTLARRLSKVGRFIGLLTAVVVAANGYYFYETHRQISSLQGRLAKTEESLAARISTPVSVNVRKVDTGKIAGQLAALNTAVSQLREKLDPLVRQTAAPAAIVSAQPPTPTPHQEQGPLSAEKPLEDPPSKPATARSPIHTVDPSTPPEGSGKPDTGQEKAPAETASTAQVAARSPTPTVERPPSRPAPKQSTGPWVINLLALKREKAAERFVAKARQQGISVAMDKAEGKKGTFWRLRIVGFGSARDAKKYAEEITPRLGLKSTWISKQ